MPTERRLSCLLLACACAAVLSSRPARAGEPWEASPEPELSVTAQLVLGWGHERVAPDAPDGVHSGLSILVRRRGWAAGPLFEAAGGDAHDSAYLGLAAGAVVDPAPWMRVELLAEGGAHWIFVENPYAWQPSGRAALPYLGARAALLVLGHTFRSPMLLWARRAGVGLQIGVRTDLSRASVGLSYPPEMGLPPDVEDVGGSSLTALLVLPIEW
ncbi:MAG TPA: hypothetical protein VLS93_02570 [Anaeromyxobacteraceae bacterium]|nr:hypothetical protein [Anaeromyxobacteraceae bacterium]